MWHRALILALTLLATAGTLSAQVVQGTLLDDVSGRPLERGRVSLLGRDSSLIASATTDSTGSFRLDAPRRGAYRLRAETTGYHAAISPPLQITTDTLTVEFRLSTQVVMLDPVLVTGTRRRRSPLLADFYERANTRAFGRFITREQIEKRHPTNTTDMLRTIPGIMLTPRRIGGGYDITVRGNCNPTIVMDGVLVRLFGASVDHLISPHDLEGIEVYRTASDAPPQYTGLKGGCAVIMFWTRHD